MTIKINYSKKQLNKSSSHLVFFSNEKLKLNHLKNNLSDAEFAYINNLLKNADLKKRIFIFEINYKKKFS